METKWRYSRKIPKIIRLRKMILKIEDLPEVL
jgi:hypothetical protein